MLGGNGVGKPSIRLTTTPPTKTGGVVVCALKEHPKVLHSTPPWRHRMVWGVCGCGRLGANAGGQALANTLGQNARPDRAAVLAMLPCLQDGAHTLSVSWLLLWRQPNIVQTPKLKTHLQSTCPTLLDMNI